MSLRLQDDQMCYVCGIKNTQGFRLVFEYPSKGVLKASTVFSKEHQGFENIVHGGILSMFLDEMMVNLAWREGIPAVTAELKVRFKKPAKVGQKVYFEGRLEGEGRGGKVIYAISEAKNEAGEMLAQASAVCVRVPQAV